MNRENDDELTIMRENLEEKLTKLLKEDGFVNINIQFEFVGKDDASNHRRIVVNIKANS